MASLLPVASSGLSGVSSLGAESLRKGRPVSAGQGRPEAVAPLAETLGDGAVGGFVLPLVVLQGEVLGESAGGGDVLRHQRRAFHAYAQTIAASPDAPVVRRAEVVNMVA